jgi:hypothetical protein
MEDDCVRDFSAPLSAGPMQALSSQALARAVVFGLAAVDCSSPQLMGLLTPERADDWLRGICFFL